MANSRSTLMANLLAKPITMNDVHEARGQVRVEIAEVVSIAGDAAGHLYVLTRLKATDRILAIFVQNTADAGWTDCNIGPWAAGDWVTADQVVVDADVLVDGLALTGARDDLEDAGSMPLGSGANALAPTLAWKAIWEVAGLAAAPDPGTQYDIVMQSIGDPAGGGTARFMFLVATGD